MELANYAQIGIAVGLISWAVYSAYNGFTKKADEQERRIIENYQIEVQQFKERLDRQGKEIDDLRSQISGLVGENRIMRELLEGKDKDSLEHRQRLEAAIKRNEHIDKKTDAILKHMDKLYNLLEAHLQTAA